jgi:ribosomal protein L31E
MSVIAPVRTVRLGSIHVEGDTESRTELDSHADTCVVGEETALVIHDFEQPVRVFGYDEAIGQATNFKTVSAIIAYIHPETGEKYMLTIHQAILIPQMKANLLSPMQLRDNDLRVNDEPKYMALNPTDDHHAIVIPGKGDDATELRIPLALQGVISYFPSSKPTQEEYESTDLDLCLDLTYESPEWDPSSPMYGEQEAAMLDSYGRLKDEMLMRRNISSIHREELATEFGLALQRNVYVSVMRAVKPRYSIQPSVLAKNWNIGLKTAKHTLEATLQRAVRTTIHPTLSRRFRTNDRQLRYRRLAHDMFTDTMKAGVTSWFRQNRYAQVFTTRFGWVRVFPMQKKSQAHEALSLLAQRDGVPPVMIMDGSKEQTMGKFRQKAREMGMRIKQTEPYSPWQNAAEGAIREVKRGAVRKMTKANSPALLWDHCLELEGYIRSCTALDIYELHGQVPETILSGQTADISPFVQHGWFDWIKWYDLQSTFPEPRERLGRWLGPSLDIGPAMTSKVLKENGQLIHLSSIRPLTEDEINDPEQKKLRDAFDRKLSKKLGRSFQPSDLDETWEDAETPEYELYNDDVEGQYHPIPDIDDVTPEDADNYIGAKVSLPLGGTMQSGQVMKRARDDAGDVYGTQNDNPILDTRVYQVEFPDGEVAEYAANVIAENMFAQCDPSGNTYMLLDSIIDHKVGRNALTRENQFVTVNGRQHYRKTTTGWKLCVEWKDGSTSWERLADLKESYPIEVAEYAVAHGIDKEPAFAWWVPYVLRKRDRIIAAVNKRYHSRTHKFGFEIPKTVERALEIDRELGNTLWRDAIAKEMSAVRVAFKILNDGEEPPVGYQFMKCHMVFDIKLDGFKRKARLVAGGHMTEAPPAVATFASVVSRETVRLALTIAALNDLEVKAGDVQNAYLTAPCEEHIWTQLGPEFGPNQGKKAIIVRALYGLKTAGSSFQRHLADCMRMIGYQSCKADPDLWYKAMVRPEDGFKYYGYVLLYVDDCLCINHDAERALQEIDKYFPMKAGSIGDPDIYLGAKLRKVRLTNGVEAWAMSPSKYVKDAVANAEIYLAENFGGRKLLKRASAPWPTDYVAELDTSKELNSTLASYYQSQIGVLHWMVELGRVDIITEVSTLASYMALPREGHLDAVFHVFAYLKIKHNSRMVFDPSYPEIDASTFQEHDWTEFYGDIKEAIPPDRPKSRGKEIDIRMFVDSDHAGDKLTRRSRTGFFVYVNSAPICWLSKKQATIETSVFGAEFVAMKHGVEVLRGLRYKLRMMGVPISGPSFIYGDNMSVIHNTQRPESTLKKKSNQICYHAVRESIAMGESLTSHISSQENPADLATKLIPGGQKRNYLVSKILYDIYDYD